MVLVGEKQQRVLAQELLGDNLEAEAVPMTFPLNTGVEEIRAVPMAYIPDLRGKVMAILEECMKR